MLRSNSRSAPPGVDDLHAAPSPRVPTPTAAGRKEHRKGQPGLRLRPVGRGGTGSELVEEELTGSGRERKQGERRPPHRRSEPDAPASHAGADRPQHGPTERHREDQPFRARQCEQDGEQRRAEEAAARRLVDERERRPGQQERDEADLHSARRAPDQRPADGGEQARPHARAWAGQPVTEPVDGYHGAGEAEDAESHGEPKECRPLEAHGIGDAEYNHVHQAARAGADRLTVLVLERLTLGQLAGVLEVDVDVVQRGYQVTGVVPEADGDEQGAEHEREGDQRPPGRIAEQPLAAEPQRGAYRIPVVLELR